MAPPVSAATRGPTLSITSRVPKGTTLGSTDTVSRELGLPEAVTPLPVWQLTSKMPSSTPRAPVVLAGACEGAGRVVPGGAAGAGFAALQAPRRIPLATAPSSAAADARRRHRFNCAVVRNVAETVIWEPLDSRNEHQEVPVKARSAGWLVWSRSWS
jgi:hypothetical protein